MIQDVGQKKITGNPSYLIDYYISTASRGNRAFAWIKEEKEFKQLEKMLESKKKDSTMLEALAIYSNEAKRVIVNSFILADTSNEEIADWLQINVDVVNFYMNYFFKKEVLRSKLDQLAYISTSGPKEKDSYEYATKFGKEFLRWKICGVSIKADDLKVELKEMMSLAKFNAKIASMNPITGEQSKEALKWMDKMIKLTEVMSRLELAPGGALSEEQSENSMRPAAEIMGVLVKFNPPVEGTKSITEFGDEEVS